MFPETFNFDDGFVNGRSLTYVGFEVREHPGRIADVETALTTLGAFLRTFRHGVVSRLALVVMTRV